MSEKILIPPLKTQGIKSKIVPHILNLAKYNKQGTYFEPFMGSGVVGFNLMPQKAIFSDTNPHIISFYNAIKKGIISKDSTREFLSQEGAKLAQCGQDYYLEVRARFNNYKNPFDFLFLNRSCFNGLMRFNLKGDFNVPYCKKDKRFSQSYITKICNQVDWVAKRFQSNDWTFICSHFANILNQVKESDFVYCDPPYIDRYSDFFNKWGEKDELELFYQLNALKAPFILSTWHSNAYRTNEYIKTTWNKFDMNFITHFYHLGANERNRNAIKEVLIKNYTHNRINTNLHFIESLFKAI